MVGQTHFTEVEEEDRGRSTYIDSSRKEGFDWAQWISIGVLSMILIGCIAALLIFTRPKSADVIYDQIIAAVDSGDDSQLMEVEPLLDELEDLYPDDPRLEQLQPLRKDVQLIRTTRKLLRRARSEGGTENLDPIEQAFLDCYQARSLGNAQVTAKLDALLAVFAANDSLPDQQKKLIELARYMQEQIRKQPQSLTHPAAEQLADQMRWATTQLPPELRTTFHKGIIELYQDKEWAQAIVEQAKNALEMSQ